MYDWRDDRGVSHTRVTDRLALEGHFIKMNPYQVLGLQPGASGDDIKRAFRRLASENHPDKNPGDTAKEAQFKQINEAYQMLGDESKRHIYDTRGARPPHINIDDIFSVMNQDFGSIFNHPPIYPGRKVPQQPPVETSHRGDDITVDLNLTLAEAVYGCKKSVAVRSPRPQAVCQVCFGEGGNPGSKRINCTTCGGSGKVVQLGMQFPRITACQVCRGLGSTPITPCHSCGGQGRIVHEAEVLVTVPAGIDKGQQLRLAGRGAPGVPPGDLYLNVLIADHMVFTRS